MIIDQTVIDNKQVYAENNDDTFIKKLEKNAINIPSTTLNVKEALRFAAITTPEHQQEVFAILMDSKLSDINDITKIQKQEVEYKKIKNELKKLIKDIDVEKNYQEQTCTSIDQEFKNISISKKINKDIKIMDYGSTSELLDNLFGNPINLSYTGENFINDEALITKLTVVSIPNHHLIRQDLRIKTAGLTTAFNIKNTSILVSKRVGDGINTYVMNPSQLYKSINTLSDETINQYAFYILNLKEVNQFNDDMYDSFKSIYKRNAGLCLYSSIK